MMIKRSTADQIKKRLFRGKAIILYGARQVGKSTLIEKILQKEDYYFGTTKSFKLSEKRGGFLFLANHATTRN